jgi:hypothetical protein
MSTFHFISLVVFITFATGFMVAAIIWGINHVFSLDIHRVEIILVSFFNRIFNNRIIKGYKKILDQNYKSDSQKEDLENRELYTYYHGKN